jgi:ribosomal protein L29
MTVKEIREKETGHLREELAERRKHLLTCAARPSRRSWKTPASLRKTRKEIAQMQTILRQRELEASRSRPSPRKSSPRRRLREEDAGHEEDGRQEEGGPQKEEGDAAAVSNPRPQR